VGGRAIRSISFDYSLTGYAWFRTYLTDTVFCFESFADPDKVSRVTRHTVAHGVANDALLNEKAARSVS
jgi:hypothetical protein